MLGFFGALDLGARSLRTHRQGVEIAGQNLANVNNPAYARQRLQVQTSFALPSSFGPQGTGVEAVAIQQIRDALLDKKVLGETSVTGFLASRQKALEWLQRGIGGSLQTEALEGSSAANATGLAAGISKFFSALQGLSAAPGSMTERQNVIAAAQQLAASFKAADDRIGTLEGDLNAGVKDGVAKANDLLQSIAELNRDIYAAEGASGNVANDLRDTRQQRLEELSSLVNFESSTDASGNLNVSVGGSLLVSGQTVADRLQAYDAGSGRFLLRTETSGAPVLPTSGAIQGTIDARDNTVAPFRQELNLLASEIISSVNSLHRTGFNLDGGTGADLLTGTGAASMGVNAALVEDPRKLQASGVAGETGNNQIILALARLRDQPHATLNGQSFQQSYATSVGGLSRELANTNDRLAEQDVMDRYLQAQRASISGVSIDEEMTDIVKFEKAFQASARLVSTLSQMLDEVVNLKR